MSGSRHFPPNRGVQWPNTVGSTLWGMTSGAAVVLYIVLRLAEIAPAFCQPCKWRGRHCRVYGSPDMACPSGGEARGGPGPFWTKYRCAS